MRCPALPFRLDFRPVRSAAALLAALSVLAACQPREPQPGTTPDDPAKPKTEARSDAPAGVRPQAPPVRSERDGTDASPYVLPGMEAARPSPPARPSAPSDEPSDADASGGKDKTGRAAGGAAPPQDAPPAGDDAPLPDGLERAVARYLALSAGNDLDALLALYADRVRYYDRGTVDRAAVRADKQRYVRRWPVRRFTPTSGPHVRVGEEALSATVRFDYAFDVSDPASGRTRAGAAWTELALEPARGRWRIVAERGGVR